MLLKNKKALVTGSSRGIGRKIVEVFLANGADVWGLCSRPSAAKAELEALAAQNGVQFHEICADAGNAEELTNVIKAALKEAGGFDVLVNNAGITRVRRWIRSSQIEFGRTVSVDLFLETVPYAETRGYGRQLVASAALYAYLYHGTSIQDTVKMLVQKQ